MPDVIIGPFRVTAGADGNSTPTATEQRWVQEFWDHCTYPEDKVGGQIELRITDDMDAVPGTTSKAWGTAPNDDLIKIGRTYLNRLQFEYACCHEFGHVIDGRKNNTADHNDLDGILTPDLGYVNGGIGWKLPSADTNQNYRRRANECYAHNFAYIYADDTAPWAHPNKILSLNYYKRHVEAGDYALFKTLSENGAGDGSGGDSDGGHTFKDNVTFVVAKDLSRRRKPNKNVKEGAGRDGHLPLGLIGDYLYDALIQFDLDWPEGIQVITQADLDVTVTAALTSHISGSGDKSRIIAARVLKDWAEGTHSADDEGDDYKAADWADPQWATTDRDLGPIGTAIAGKDFSLDALDFIQDWAPTSVTVQGKGKGKALANHGMYLRVANQKKIEGATEIGSGENPTTAWQPTIYVQFEPTAATPIAMPLYPEGTINTDLFFFEGTYGDPLGKDNLGQIDMQVRRTSNGNIVWHPPIRNADANERVTGHWYINAQNAPAGMWVVGRDYQWQFRVKSEGSGKWSDWTDWEDFVIDNTPPTVVADNLGAHATLDHVYFGGVFSDPDDPVNVNTQTTANWATAPVGFPRHTMWWPYWKSRDVAGVAAVIAELKAMKIGGVVLMGKDWGGAGTELPADVVTKLDMFIAADIKPYVGLWMAKIDNTDRTAALEAWDAGDGRWAGAVLDLEDGWADEHTAHPGQTETHLTDFIADLRAAGATMVAYSSYGVPSLHDSMDYEFLDTQFDLFLPQVYFSGVHGDEDEADVNRIIDRAVHSINRKGLVTPFILTVNAWGEGANPDNRRLYATRALTEQGAFTTWRYPIRNSAVRDVYASLDIEPPPPTQTPSGVINTRLQLRAEPEGDPAWDGDTGFLWDTHEVSLTADESAGGRVRRRYAGSALDADDYTYRLQVQDRMGAWSAWSYGTITLTVGYEPDPGAAQFLSGYGKQRKTRVCIYDMGTNRGPNQIKAIIYDHMNAGASMVANDVGEFYFTLPTTHAQASEIEPLQRHYTYEFWRNGRWKPVFYGLITDMEADENECVFYGLDYIGLLSKNIETVEADWDNPEKSFDTGGDKYLDKTISYVIKDQLTRAKAQTDSPLGFIDVEAQGASVLMETLSEKISIHVAYKERLALILGLIQSSKQGTGRRTRLWPERKADGTYQWRLRLSAGQDRTNLRLRYGELVQGFNLVVIGEWASKVYGIGRVTNETKVRFKNASAPGIDTSIWGNFGMVGVWQDLVDENDLARRVKQLAIEMGKFGKSVALGLRVHGLEVLDGWDLCDNIPVEIIRGAVDTTRYGSGWWTIWGCEYREYQDGHDELTLAVRPREDSTPPDTNLIPSRPISNTPEWSLGGWPAEEELLWEDTDAALWEDGTTILLSSSDPLPALPDERFPPGTTVVWLSDGRLYRNIGNVWVKDVHGDDILDGTLPAVKIVPKDVTADQIALDTVTHDEIAPLTITDAELAVGSVIASKIDVATLSAISADMGTLVAGLIRDAASRILLELASQRLRVNDGTNDRVLVGAIGGGDFGLLVKNAGGTVIVDGTSNMFKVVASGGFSKTLVANTYGPSTPAVASVGGFTTNPAHLIYLSFGNTAAAARSLSTIFFDGAKAFVADTSGGPVTTRTWQSIISAHAAVGYDGSGNAVITVWGNNADSTDIDVYGYYYLLKEASI